MAHCKTHGKKTPRPGTIKANGMALARIMKALGVDDVAKIDAGKLRAALLPENPTDSQENGFNSAIRCAKSLFKKDALRWFNDAERNWGIFDPFASYQLAAPRVEAYIPLDLQTQEAILNDCKKELHPIEQLIIYMGFYTGLRRGEIEVCKMDWWTEQQDRMILTVKESATGKPKSGKLRSFPFSKAVYQQMLEMRAAAMRDFNKTLKKGEEAKPDTDYFVPNPRSARKKDRLWKRCANVNRWLGSKGIDCTHKLHSLRKQAGSDCASDFSLFDSQKMLGHKDPKTTSDYYASSTHKNTYGEARKAPDPFEAMAAALGITVEEVKDRMLNRKPKKKAKAS